MDPYTILGVSPSATDDEVKKAYRTLSKKYHPDANINSVHQEEYTEKFKQVQNAYKTIMDYRKKGYSSQGYQSYNNTYQYAGNDQVAYNEAAGFLQARRFQEAMNVLDQIKNKTSVWFYYSAIAQNGLGNNIAAMQLAQTAVQMEPNNLQYIMLLQQLQGSQRQYRTASQAYGSPFAQSINCCYSMMLMNLLMSCCCGC